MARPPPLPGEQLARTLRLATFDGRGLLLVAGAFAAISAAFGDAPGALAGCVAAGAGAVELHGVGLLRGREIRGVNWLVASQLLLLVTLIVYAAQRFSAFDPAWMRARMSADVRTLLDEAGISMEQALQLAGFAWRATYATLAAVATVYQGGLAFYYSRQRKAIEAALR